MLFFKYYDPAKEKIYYMGHMYVGITAKMSSVVPDLVQRASLPAGTPLAIYEEIRPNYLEKVDDLEKPLEHVLEELMDGDIIVFQKATADGNYRYAYISRKIVSIIFFSRKFPKIEDYSNYHYMIITKLE